MFSWGNRRSRATWDTLHTDEPLSQHPMTVVYRVPNAFRDGIEVHFTAATVCTLIQLYHQLNSTFRDWSRVLVVHDRLPPFYCCGVAITVPCVLSWRILYRRCYTARCRDQISESHRTNAVFQSRLALCVMTHDRRGCGVCQCYLAFFSCNQLHSMQVVAGDVVPFSSIIDGIPPWRVVVLGSGDWGCRTHGWNHELWIG